jgi:hypothetical protein
MRIRCYPEGDVDRASEYEVGRPDLGIFLLSPTLARQSQPTPERTSSALALYAKTYAEEELASEVDGPVNIVVEPLDDEARALPGWHPPEKLTPEEEAADEDEPLPFRLFVLTARVEVEWSAREVQTFNPNATPAATSGEET